MMSFLRADTDSVELSAVSFSGLASRSNHTYKRTTGQYILHRLVYKKKTASISQVMRKAVEGPLLPGQLVAVVSNIWRGQAYISIEHFPPSALFFWWLRLP